MIPTASACCLPSAIIVTTVFFSQGVILPPGDVSPGAIILAPLSTNLIAPLSTCCTGSRNGSLKRNLCIRPLNYIYSYIFSHLWMSLRTGMNDPSRCLKNNGSPLDPAINSIWSWLNIDMNLFTDISFFILWANNYHFIIRTLSFFGKISSM